MPRNVVEEKLIDLVRERPILYDKAHPNYKDRNMKENTWTRIQEQLDTHLTGKQ